MSYETNMNNSIKPAYPIATTDQIGTNRIGLTKRERFAMAAMQGLLTSITTADGHIRFGKDEVIDMSVDHADALLKALEE